LAWKVEGDYFEYCNCNVACQCIYLSDPDNGFCDVMPAWHIESGEFDGTKLDGLNVAAFFHAPGNMAKVGKWEAALYIDGKANDEQADALTKIFSGQAGGHLGALAPLIGKVLGVKRVPIEFRVEGKVHTLDIPGIAHGEVEPVKGIDPSKETYLFNPPLTLSPQFPNQVGVSHNSTYSDYDKRLDSDEKNAFFMKFSYSA
jgi:hypothetical protein